MTDTADDIVRFLADELGMGAEKIGPTDRLLEDLGMDGDDAVEFFEVFGPRFGVDLTPLYEHWDQHFGPEGVGLLAVALAVWSAWKRRARRNHPHIPVRVQDLLSAAKSGRWAVIYA